MMILILAAVVIVTWIVSMHVGWMLSNCIKPSWPHVTHKWRWNWRIMLGPNKWYEWARRQR